MRWGEYCPSTSCAVATEHSTWGIRASRPPSTSPAPHSAEDSRWAGLIAWQSRWRPANGTSKGIKAGLGVPHHCFRESSLGSHSSEARRGGRPMGSWEALHTYAHGRWRVRGCVHVACTNTRRDSQTGGGRQCYLSSVHDDATRGEDRTRAGSCNSFPMPVAGQRVIRATSTVCLRRLKLPTRLECRVTHGSQSETICNTSQIAFS